MENLQNINSIHILDGSVYLFVYAYLKDFLGIFLIGVALEDRAIPLGTLTKLDFSWLFSKGIEGE